MAVKKCPVPLLVLFRRTTQAMIDELVERLAAAGFPNQASYGYVLENIDPEGTRLTTLAARAGLKHQSMGELVAKLEQQGYVERIADPADGRARLVRPTDSGQALLRTAMKEMRAIEKKWMARWKRAGLDDDLRAVLTATLGGR